MSALTDPSRVPIHSLMRGTSFWTTATTETSGGGGGGGSFRLQAVEKPNVTMRRALETVFMGTPGKGEAPTWRSYTLRTRCQRPTPGRWLPAPPAAEAGPAPSRGAYAYLA